MRIPHRKDYISEKEFNRMLEGAGMPLPEDDSKDDSAVDENTEIEMGEDYPFSTLEERKKEEDQDEIERKINRAAHDRFSTWPDPI